MKMMGFAGLNPSYELHVIASALHVIASAAKQSILYFAAQWIASLRSQ